MRNPGATCDSGAHLLHSDWRGPYGAYNATDMMMDEDPKTHPSGFKTDGSGFGGHALNLLGRSLEALVEDPKYSDWLFVFGTVIAFGDRGQTAKKGERYDNWNFAPVYKGGPQGKFSHAIGCPHT